MIEEKKITNPYQKKKRYYGGKKEIVDKEQMEIPEI